MSLTNLLTPNTQALHIITNEALYELTQMVVDVTGLYKEVKEENEKLKAKLLLSPEEVAEKTPWVAKTILKRKAEIGYVAMGKEISFEPDKVQAWIKKYSIAPKVK